MNSQAKKWSTAQTRSDTVQSAYWGVEFIPRIYLLYCPIGKQYHIYSRLDIPIYICIQYIPRGGENFKEAVELEYTWLQKTLAANNNLWQD